MKRSSIALLVTDLVTAGLSCVLSFGTVFITDMSALEKHGYTWNKSLLVGPMVLWVAPSRKFHRGKSTWDSRTEFWLSLVEIGQEGHWFPSFPGSQESSEMLWGPWWWWCSWLACLPPSFLHSHLLFYHFFEVDCNNLLREVGQNKVPVYTNK